MQQNNTIQLGFYPGCSLKGSSSDYSQSVLALAKVFNIQLTEIDDWSCCGATAAHNINKELALSLTARILALAEKQGLTEIVVPCAACYNRLTVVQHELKVDEALKKRVTDIIQMPFSGNLVILNVMQMIDKYITPFLDKKIVTQFQHKVACYYGCLLVRPHNILQFDRLEDPQSMDVLMQKIGANSIDWAFKTECCGAGFSVSKTEIVAKLSGNILKDAADRGAEAVVVACPMCQSNLDMRRSEINKYLKGNINIPVIYVTQAIGLAVGLSKKELGLHRLYVPAKFE